MLFAIAVLTAYFMLRASREIFNATAKPLQVAALAIVALAFLLWVGSIGSPEWAVSDLMNFTVTTLFLAFALQLVSVWSNRQSPDAIAALLASDATALLVIAGVVFESTLDVHFRALTVLLYIVALSFNAYTTIEHLKGEN